MLQDSEVWSPEQELRLLEELAEAEAKAFDLDLGLPVPETAGGVERPWVAYWYLPPDGIRVKPRTSPRTNGGRQG